MRRLSGLSILMILTILGITAFQLYWLKETYEREEKTLAIKTDISFREVVRKLQAKKLNIENLEEHMRGLSPDARGGVFISNKKMDSLTVKLRGKEEIISTLNIVRSNWKESKMPHPDMKERVIISMNQDADSGKMDSLKFLPGLPLPARGEKGNYVMQFLYDVDSLQDSVRIHEIEASYNKVMGEQKINIPFTVLRLDSTMEEHSTDVSVGLAHPVVYRLKSGNNVPYLLKRMSSPILFSLFLSALTILSFVLLFRNLKKQQRLAELKNDFISNITHELKTPIATVGVAIEALKNFNAIQNPERTKEYLDISSNELQRLNLLVDKVLKLSMFEKKEIELNFETINLKGLVDEVLASMRLLLDKKKAVVSLNHSGDLTLSGDRLHLLSVIYNLADNAIKYSNDGAVIKISLQEKENNVLLSIADNGIGIPDEYKSKVFEKFFRVPAGNIHNTKGYGLGLSYVAGVVTKHHGTIEVQNNEGGGTVFNITLPKAPIP